MASSMQHSGDYAVDQTAALHWSDILHSVMSLVHGMQWEASKKHEAATYKRLMSTYCDDVHPVVVLAQLVGS